ncbi:aldehyde dehydrogenase (NADP(+)) [Microbacterium pseudoresistens]|uniref:NADP-dependent aldehyde dehydrogenase n=1 Tax=Microbacterium pseudoresistens TaxID=640634 RepID=A0A7Y9ET04_9MICO|nr:aldehyde dehydrogenase (NADP(+)) [Microbacterium pseudoresistens]NYD53306.1 NADP-dependent aldehyde dehydrogenase [Microbacterium pseudoresistens]
MTSADVEQIASNAAAAAPTWSRIPLNDRARLLVNTANQLESARAELVALASEETGLGEERLNNELTRTVVQARLFGDVAARGEFLDVRIDEHDDQFVLGPRPDLRRYLVPIGPVLNFAASNFPFAFSVFGGDSVSALAAGCPVIVKLHSGHPRLGARTTQLVQEAVRDEGHPDGVFQSISGQAAGVELLQDPRIRAGSFTGSTRIGTYLARIAAERPTPIPFYGELGSVNPVFVFPGALGDDEALAQGLAASVSSSAGQLCTKPGFVFVPAGTGWASTVAEALSPTPAHRLLTPSISTSFEESVDSALRAGVTGVLRGSVRTEDGLAWVTPSLLQTDTAHLLAHPDLADELFGPATILVEYEHIDQALTAATQLFPGNLTCTIHAADNDDQVDVERVLAWGIEHAGRVLYGGWPTGVGVTGAQQHGGPWPATTDAQSTAVGTASIQRFLRPVALQNVPERLRPTVLADANHWKVPQSRNAEGPSQAWGDSVRAVEP